MSRPPADVEPVIKPPFPITFESEIIAGFGRGLSELGIPTANINIMSPLDSLDNGIYYGYCRVTPVDCNECEVKRANGKAVDFNFGRQLEKCDQVALPMVMSVGYNPFYKNTTKAAEVHIMHKFPNNFYGAHIRYTVLGYIRPELDYTTREALIADINKDIDYANFALLTPSCQEYKSLVA